MKIRDRIKELRRVPAKDLAPNPRNWRKHPQEQADALRGVLAEIGWADALIARELEDGTLQLIDGHLRAETAPEEQVPVLVLDVDGAEAAKILATLDPLASMAETNQVALDALLAEIETDSEALAKMLSGMASPVRRVLGDADGDVPEIPEEPVTKEGDLIILGGHRLVCGDSQDTAVLAQLMDGAKAALYATDPPYGVGYDGTSHPQNERDKQRGRERGSQNRDWSQDYEDLDAWDHFADKDQFEQFLAGVFKVAMPHLTPDAAWYCWHASATADSFRRAWEAAGIRYHQTITWVKPTFVLGFAMWNYRSEPCLMGWQQGHKPPVFPVLDEHSNVWEVDWEGKARCTDGVHPTQKPVRLFELPMMKHTRPGEICLETFAGSGSQVIAAERLGRRCFAVECNPRFCDVIVARWEQFVGQKAVRP